MLIFLFFDRASYFYQQKTQLQLEFGYQDLIVSKSSQFDLLPTQEVFYAYKFICTFRCRKFASTKIFKIFRSLRGEVLFCYFPFRVFLQCQARSFAIKRVRYSLLSFSTKFKKRIHYRSERKKGVTAIFVFFRVLFCSVYFKINFIKI